MTIPLLAMTHGRLAKRARMIHMRAATALPHSICPMAATEPSSAGLDPRRRRLRYRAWHRGTREMDLVLGRFADAVLPALGPAEVNEFEALIEAPDPDLFAWLTEARPVPPKYDTPLFRRFKSFHARPTSER
jgi:antitoxin CptB